MIIVTGEIRTGTSLIMQTLNYLGIPVVGNKLAQDKRDEVQELNPLGFYELPEIIKLGLDDGEAMKYKNSAIKITTQGMARTLKSKKNFELTSNILYCIRNPKESLHSQRKLISIINSKEIPKEEEFIVDGRSFIAGNAWFIIYLKKDKEIRKKVTIIDYNVVVEHPEDSIEQLVKILKIEPTKEQFNAAINNVRRSLRKSRKEMIEWKDEKIGKLAQKFYEGMLFGNLYEITDEENDLISKIVSSTKLENVIWLDTEYNTLKLCDAMHIRDFEKNSPKPSKTGKFKECEFYEEKESNSVYVIYRPYDLGPILRQTVYCKKLEREVTLEECYLCWNKEHDDVRRNENITSKR